MPWELWRQKITINAPQKKHCKEQKRPGRYTILLGCAKVCNKSSLLEPPTSLRTITPGKSITGPMEHWEMQHLTSARSRVKVERQSRSGRMAPWLLQEKSGAR